MNFAIFSDVHSNLQALRAVLESIRRPSPVYPDMILCLGDIVGYGASPLECLELLEEKRVVCLKGNHDKQIVDLSAMPEDMKDEARKAIIWARGVLDKRGPGLVERLAGLPELKDFPAWDLAAAHGSCVGDYCLRYLRNWDENTLKSELENSPRRLSVVGHTHYPLIYGKNRFQAEFSEPYNIVELNGPDKYLLNVGSVGQPRNGDFRACWAFLSFVNRNRAVVRFNFVPYDVQGAAEAILAAGLPEFFAQRLYQGK